jgi:hypothetical protein
MCAIAALLFSSVATLRSQIDLFELYKLLASTAPVRAVPDELHRARDLGRRHGSAVLEGKIRLRTDR